jgi:hypothetical protein
MAENAPRPPLYPNSPKPLLKKPQTPPKCCDKIALTHKFPVLYIQLSPKRVLINSPYHKVYSRGSDGASSHLGRPEGLIRAGTEPMGDL